VELEAQIEDHGTSAIQFYLDQEDPETGENMELDVVDVKYEDDKIRVTLG
jgi:hypothetical protein